MGEFFYMWWVWISLALVLAIFEVVIPGYFFLGFAIGALGIGGLVALQMAPESGPQLLALFSILSLLSYLALRKVFKLEPGQVKLWDRDINDD